MLLPTMLHAVFLILGSHCTVFHVTRLRRLNIWTMQ
ncbi:hypothetical protein NC652_008669 [Populus alba x Populus x berolinensis]|nr:hypothetical protein NC652_008669 [Populus alba x Populus x berolinensis]